MNLEELNDVQREAVTWDDKPLLILAGAGSGKTRILTHRIAYIISQGVPSFHILGVTFTNKAAQEMKLRVQRLVQQDVWISTFHSTCMKILRMDGAAIGLDSQFTVYDEQDQKTLIKECIKELGMNDKQVHPKAVMERIQRAKDQLWTAKTYLAEAQDIFDESVGKIYERYEKKMLRLNACDFGDLIMKAVFLMQENELVLGSWRDRFRNILIDEYQDTNHAQYRLAKYLVGDQHRITAVGDPDQSIYSWRGADINNILSFERDYPECGIIRLEQNYRSSGLILDAANALIDNNQRRKPKRLWTEREEGDKIGIYEAFNEREEADAVVSRVMELNRQDKKLSDQVIFYRVHAQSRVIEDSLRRGNIPYKILGGVRFYDRKEIKDVIAYLRVILNPSDDVSLKRILNVPPRGIGKKAWEVLEQEVTTTGQPLFACLRNVMNLKLMPKAKEAIKRFYNMIEHFRAHLSDLDISTLLQEVLDRSGYLHMLQLEKTIEAQSRIENIEEFFSVIQDFEQEQSKAGANAKLVDFIENISLHTNLDQWEEGSNVLTLMTLHTAKGLEFPIVHMVGLEEGIFPNVNVYDSLTEELEEERRLCYVGITRAKDRLFMSYARQRLLYGTTQHNLPSRFLTEIPSELYEQRLQLAQQDDFEDPFPDDDTPEIDFDGGSRRSRILFD